MHPPGRAPPEAGLAQEAATDATIGQQPRTPNEQRLERDLCHMNSDRLVVCAFGLPALLSTLIEPPGDECSTGGIRASIVQGYQYV
jgi:hypothetical protein